MGSEDRTLTLGTRNVTVQPFSGRKIIRAMKLLRGITEGAPEVLEAWAKFTSDYEKNNSVTLTRAEALFEFPPAVNEAGVTVRAGRLDHLSDDDWAASGNKITVPKTPGNGEKIAAVFPKAMDLAEESVTRLLALVAIGEPELKAARGDVEAKLDELAEDLLDAPYEELLHLAVLGGESVDEQYVRKAQVLGDRVGNAARLVGLNPGMFARRRTSSTAKPTSSSASPTPSAGDPTSPSAPTGDSSSASTID